jgi:hypothetical protein
MKRDKQKNMFINLWKLEFGYSPVDWNDAMKFKRATFPIIGIDIDYIGISHLEEEGILVAVYPNTENERRRTQLVKSPEPVSIKTLEESNHGL